MKFGPVSIDDALGKILGHNIAGADGRRALRKGKPLEVNDLALLRSLGRVEVYVAEVEAQDVGENAAAQRIAVAVAGNGLTARGPSTGRVNLHAGHLGVFRVDREVLEALNGCSGVTLATLRNHSAVGAGRMVATVKILPYALSRELVEEAEQIAAQASPLIAVDPLPERRVSVILSGSTAGEKRVVDSFMAPLQERLTGLGAKVTNVVYIPLEDTTHEAQLAGEIRSQIERGEELIILAGETAIMDLNDLAPSAVVRAGGTIVCFGAPVDPGNLLLLAYVGDTPVVGAPGCVRSPKRNVIDEILPRLLCGDRLQASDIVAWAHGGLLEDVPERPYPRSRVG